MPEGEAAAFAIKVEAPAKTCRTLVFRAQKTMYGGKRVRQGDVLFFFDSENEGGVGLSPSAAAFLAGYFV